MTRTFTHETRDGITTARFTRAVTYADLEQANLEVVRNHPSRRRLWDITHGIQLTTEEIRRFAKFSKSLPFPTPSRVAILVSEDLTFGLARMYEVFREQIHHETGVFRDEVEARAWLMALAEPDPDASDGSGP